MSFWNNPENNSVKILLVVVVLAAVGAFVFYSKNTSEETTGRVINGSSVTTTTPAYLPVEGSACTHTGTPGSGEIDGDGNCCFPNLANPTNCFSGPDALQVPGKAANFSGKAQDSTTVGGMSIINNHSTPTPAAAKICKAGDYQGANGGCFHVKSDCSFTYSDSACATTLNTTSTTQSSVSASAKAQ